MIRIRKPLCFSEIGRKENQEDALYPADADASARVFILCDGMGGHENGEVASATVANALGAYLSACREVDIPVFESGLTRAYEALDTIDCNGGKRPGTTMTCLCLNDDSYLVAHIGDSRIYHIRPSLFDAATGRGGILYQSSDHSLVNDLLKAGEITEAETRDFPQKNIITRAIQPGVANRQRADAYMFDDLLPGDYFFICCDGVLEQLSNAKLCAILADRKFDDAGKLVAIKAICDGRTRDNYTCWLIPVDKVSLKDTDTPSGTIMAEKVNVPPLPRATLFPQHNGCTVTFCPSRHPTHRISRRLSYGLICVLAAVVILTAAFLTYRHFRKPTTPYSPKTEQIIKKNPKESVPHSLDKTEKNNNTVNQREPNSATPKSPNPEKTRSQYTLYFAFFAIAFKIKKMCSKQRNRPKT